jgi:hypothetical protein
MLKYSYIFFISVLLVSCNKNITNNDIEKNNQNNNSSIKEETLIDDTTDKDIDELIDILFDTNY